ncbi:MAG: recombinase family protein [Patescibacteria group bacterium]|jgi:site-specific DNA recombinase|nr:recombinase family protein [Patescibacteria group bacterium]
MSEKNRVIKGVAYIRESTEEQDKGFSPDNQERTMKEYAKKNNINIIKIYKDLVTGTSALKRDNFQQMIKAGEEGQFKIILVYHTSRFARNVREARKYKEYLREKLLIDVTSVTQHFGDWNDPSAFLNEGINELFDAYYSKQLSFWMRSAFKEKRRQGLQLGNPPLGYVKKKLGFDVERKRPIYSKEWTVDKKESQLVKKIFKMYSTGNYSYADIAEEINKTGIKTKYGYLFTYTSIKDILKNKSYLGQVFSPRRNYPTLPGKHKALIKESLFNNVQSAIEERRGTKGRPVAQHRFYLLQGLVYCYSCKKHLKGKENDENAKMLPRMYCQAFKATNKNEYLTYGCKFRREARECTQKNVRVEIIDEQVINFIKGLNVPDDIIQMTLQKLKQKFSSTNKSTPAMKRVSQLKRRKNKINFQFQNTDELSEDDYLENLRTINIELNKLQATDMGGMTNTAINAYINQTEKYIKDFKMFWDTLEKEEMQKWIHMTIKRIWVKDKKVVAIEPHDEYKILFTIHMKVLCHCPLGTPSENTPFLRSVFDWVVCGLKTL